MRLNLDPIIDAEVDAVIAPLIVKSNIKKLINTISAIDKDSIVLITSELTTLYKEVLDQMGFGSTAKDLDSIADVLSFSSSLSIWNIVDGTVQRLLNGAAATANKGS